jgi:regulatory protein
LRAFRPKRPVAAERSADPVACREAALGLLERTRRTRSDLSRRLDERGFDPTAIEAVLDRLSELKLVDDVEYARAFLAGRWGRRAAGWRRLEQDLRARGVASEDIARGRALLVEQTGAVDEVTAARKVVEQAARRYQSLDPRLRRQRLYALLTRRGFDSDVIAEALHNDR